MTGEKMTKKVNCDEPDQKKNDDCEDLLGLRKGGRKPAAGYGRDEKKPGFGKIAKFSVGEFGVGFFEDGLKINIGRFAHNPDEKNIRRNHNQKKRKKKFPVFKNDFKGREGVGEEARDF